MLGVIGMVVGGIWAAASTVNKRVLRNAIISEVSATISSMQNSFQDTRPVSSGLYGLIDYAKRNGLLNYPYSNPSQPWLGLKTPDGRILLITYYAPGAGYPGQADAITVAFQGIKPEDCYAYLTGFDGYTGIINGHGDYATTADMRASVGGNGSAFFCDYHLSNQISLIFPL